MKLAFLALLAILILGGGGAGAYFYFQQPAQASVGETEEHTQAKEKSSSTHGKEDAEHSLFVELDPLILPIVDNNGVSQIINIVIMIEVTGDKNKDLVQNLQPRLKDAYIQELYGVLNKHAALQGGVLQVGMIKERLGTISNRVLGEGVVNDVLLQVVQQRPI
ncbi:MAG: flagellar basal body-associated FliL family protein [Alphaproteobacteria bacterium CG_4_9_14_3_um_filter_47_13]|nr:MAG: flagellar basal body-associated FliL family protein [Alphaproteobacteria bacterium CG_4_9_14_3_um_filter_47_13]